MNRYILFGLWFIVLITGIVLYTFFPTTFEPFLCEDDERIALLTREIITSDDRPADATDLACINATGRTRYVGETVGVPFVILMILIPILIMSNPRKIYLSLMEIIMQGNNRRN